MVESAIVLDSLAPLAPSVRGAGCSWARAVATAVTLRTSHASGAFILLASPHGDRRRPDHVVVVSGRVENQGIDLCLTDAVGGLGRDAVCAEALRVTPTPATRPIIDAAGLTPASSSTPLMTTYGDPDQGLERQPIP